MIIYQNGQYLDSQAAVVSVNDHGFLYGVGFFETFRTFQGVPFLLQNHLERLHHSLEAAEINLKLNSSQIKQICTQLLLRNQLTDAYFRISVSAGNEGVGLPQQSYNQAQLTIHLKSLAGNINQWLPTEANKSIIVLQTPRNSSEFGVRKKSFHYMNNIIAKREVQKLPAAYQEAEGILLTADGFVAEGIVSNVFFVSQNRIYTPALSTGILPGITREMAIQISREIGLDVEQGFYRAHQLYTADEIFITNSVQGVVPVSQVFTNRSSASEIRLDQKNQLVMGPVTTMMSQKYESKIKEEIIYASS